MPGINHQQRIDGHWVIAHIIHNEFTTIRQDFYIAEQYKPSGKKLLVYEEHELGKILLGVVDTEDKAYMLVRSLFKG